MILQKHWPLDGIDLSEIANLQGSYNSIQEVMQRHCQDLRHKQDEALKHLLKERLAQLGHTFTEEAEFMDFIKERLTKISFEGEPGCYELRLDYVRPSQPGIGLVSFSTKITMSENKGEVTFTIG